MLQGTISFKLRLLDENGRVNIPKTIVEGYDLQPGDIITVNIHTVKRDNKGHELIKNPTLFSLKLYNERRVSKIPKWVRDDYKLKKGCDIVVSLSAISRITKAEQEAKKDVIKELQVTQAKQMAKRMEKGREEGENRPEPVKSPIRKLSKEEIARLKALGAQI